MNYNKTYNKYNVCPKCNSVLELDIFKLGNKQTSKIRDMVYNLEDVEGDDRLVYCIECNSTYTLDYILGYWSGYKKAIGLDS